MKSPQHHRAFGVTVAWTLGLLLLGSIVHATESSLACPDWPTCFGTLVPEMEGGVFWEHLHRLVAGGLVLIFVAATYLAYRREGNRPWVRNSAMGGIALLVVQSVFGGVTVLMRLPDIVSTTHLALAFAFLALAVVLYTVTAPGWGQRVAGRDPALRRMRPLAGAAALLTFAQSILGAVVRHMDAGLVCPDVPRCLGQWIPPLVTGAVAIHFAHRVVAVLLAVAVVALAVHAMRALAPSAERRLAISAAGVALVQVALGVLSVTTVLSVPAVSLHTLGAALLLAILVALTTLTYEPEADVQTASRTATAGQPSVEGGR
ncbi:MAG: hypothetical protein BMS9Abin29_0438 [Gemmatimonadota bacterium]|nr:MAG: hypothetical protein BMS9Abin29_0438 [Gemmatimonadota bacterium]